MSSGTVGYELIVFFHVLAAITLIGAGLIAAPAVHSHLRAADSVSEVRRWLGIGRPLARISPVSSLVLLATGATLASLGRWWNEPWLMVAVAMWVINAAVATAMKRSMARVAQLAVDSDTDGISSDLAAARRAPGMSIVPDILLAGDLGVLYLMVAKPAGWIIPIVAVLAAQAVVPAARWALWSARSAHHRPSPDDRRALVKAP